MDVRSEHMLIVYCRKIKLRRNNVHLGCPLRNGKSVDMRHGTWESGETTWKLSPYTLFMFYRSNTVSMWFFMFLRRKNIHFLAPDVPSVTQCQLYTKYFMLQ